MKIYVYIYIYACVSVPEEVKESRNAQGNVYRWVEAFRQHGHKLAAVNPISIKVSGGQR